MATRDSGSGQVQSTKLDRAWVLLHFICAGSVAGFIWNCYTVLKSSNKNETAVHGCSPVLSVSVALLSRKVNSFT